MKSHFLEFPFVKTLLPPPAPRLKGGPRGRSKIERAMRRKAVKSKAMRRIIEVVEAVTGSRGIRYQDVFSDKREHPAIADARVLAMGLCCAQDVPICIVARAFKRTWQTVYGAEEHCSRRYQASKRFRAEWDALATAVAAKSAALKPAPEIDRKGGE